MLKVLRKKGVAKKILIGLAVIIIPAFVLWGAGSLIKSRKGLNYAGIIFGKKIDFDQYNSSLLACKNQAIMRYGDDLYKIQKFLDLNAETWDRLTLLYEAKRRKIKATDTEVREKIASLPLFQKDGKFDYESYQYLSDYVFKTPSREFEEEIRQILMFEKLFEQITQSVSINDEELFENYKKENEKVKVDFIHIAPDLFINQVAIDDNEINDYFQKHKEELKKPPSVNIQYLGLEYPKDSKETDKATIIDKMKKISLKIRNAADFEKIANSEGLTIKETGYFTLEGPVAGIGWSYQFMQAAFNLRLNQISEPIETQKGCYILKLKEKKDSYIPEISEAKEKIVEILKQKKAKELAETKAREYLQTILETYQTNPPDIDFNKLAGQWNAKTGQTPLFSQQDYVPNIGKSEIFSKAAFSLKDKEEPFDVVSTEVGVFIIKLQEYIPVDEDKFLKERENFKVKTLQNKRAEYFNKFFEDLKKRANLIDNVNPSLSLLP